MGEEVKQTAIENSRAFTRNIVSLTEQSEVLEGLSLNIKAEVYGILSYFISKATNDAMQWVKDNPGFALVAESSPEGASGTRISIESFRESELVESENLSTVMFNVNNILHGLMHYHMRKLVNTYTPGPTVNERDMHILDRLDYLLIEQKFRNGDRIHSEPFLLLTTQPQARFITTTLFATFDAYRREFGLLPDPESAYFTDVANSAKKLLLKMSSMNLQDFAELEKAMEFFGDREECGYIETPLKADMTVDVDEKGRIRINNTFLSEYQPSAEAEVKESTIGCPALFARPEGKGNTIGVLTDYAISLIQRSGARVTYPISSRQDESTKF
jgi:hypothetical protein